jgi:hypothetical protein
MKLGIVVVCTNSYFVLGLRFVKQFMHYYKGEADIVFYLFTDTDPIMYAPNLNIKYIHTDHSNWVDAVNSKFVNIISLQGEDCDYLYFFDADTNISKNFTEEWFLGDLVGGEHYNNCFLTNGVPSEKPYDRNPLSSAYIPKDTILPQTYYYGAFFGGKKKHMIDFCKVLYDNQQKNKSISFEPRWNDESYLNHYFHYNPPSYTVPTSKFMFIISDKGPFVNGETRNISTNIQDYKEKILSNNTSVFDFDSFKDLKFYTN